MEQRELTIEEIKDTTLGILKFVDEFCHENGLKYFLCGGTLIGAIRHKGFIPWDDDIDIIMPRPDFIKMVHLLENGDRYRCNFLYGKKDHYPNFAKIVDSTTTLIEPNMPIDEEGLGVFVDVFPLDGLPDTMKEIKPYYRKIMFYRRMKKLTYRRKVRGPKMLLAAYAKHKGWRYWAEKIDEFGRKYDYDKAKYIGCQTSGYDEREVFTKEAFASTLRVPFEEYEFDIPVGYDEYLTKLYGDYMTLPPEDKRTTRHEFRAYWKETE